MVNQEKYINSMKDFVEGSMSIEHFWNLFNENDAILNILLSDPNRMDSISYYRADLLRAHIDINTLSGAAGLHHRIYMYFFRNNIDVHSTNRYSAAYRFLLEIQPNWLNLDEKYINQIISQAPEDFSMSKKKKWCKDKIKSLFLYDKYPPRWIQNPEWPFSDEGTPLVFRNQSKPEKYSERVVFYFYNPTTMEVREVVQFY